MKSLRVLTIAAALVCSLACSQAFAGEKTIKIGVLGDESGPYSDLGGPGSVLAAQTASPSSFRSASMRTSVLNR